MQHSAKIRDAGDRMHAPSAAVKPSSTGQVTNKCQNDCGTAVLPPDRPRPAQLGHASPEDSIEVPRSSTFLRSRLTQVGHEHRFSALPPMRRRTVQCACYTGNWLNWMKSADVDLGTQAKQIAASSGGIAKA
jgi:hypothetical protein